MNTSNYTYHDGTEELIGYLAYNKTIPGPLPAVLIVHDWSGRNEFACDKAKHIADMGYIGFAVDMYGKGKTGSTVEEKQSLMEPVISNQTLLRQRLQSALTAICSLPEVDSNRVAIIGFCFGGLCALELARSGADIKGAVSFHGLLHKPGTMKSNPIKAKILVLHGYDDPMAKPELVFEFCKEMTDMSVDWQMHMYGKVQHAFSNPQAHEPQLGLMYNAVAAERSWQSMTNFLNEIFNK